LLVGGASGTLAASVCYPLDTVRRRMQMKGQAYKNQVGSEATAASEE
jgi:solute carrier family 25 phosphate transporter 23/24/25/41